MGIVGAATNHSAPGKPASTCVEAISPCPNESMNAAPGSVLLCVTITQTADNKLVGKKMKPTKTKKSFPKKSAMMMKTTMMKYRR